MKYDINVKLLHTLALQNKYFISTAESCTGGLVASSITDLSGASQIFHCSVVAYSIFSKIDLLNIKKELIEEFGVVSAETASAMAVNLCLKFKKTNLSLSTTGFLDGKKGGFVYIASYNQKNKKLSVIKENFIGSRFEIKNQVSRSSINLLINQILDNSPKNDC